MGMFDTQENRDILLTKAFHRAKAEQDRRDFEDELAGQEQNGRIKRFLSKDQTAEAADKRGGGPRRSEAATRLQLLLASNPRYAERHAAALDALRDAERAAEKALRQLEDALRASNERLEAQRQRAAKLPDGQRVYKDQHGIARTEEGNPVAPDDAQSVYWRGDEPSYEDKVAEEQKRTKIEESIGEIRGVQVDLGDFRTELTDEDRPASEERLKELKDAAALLQQRSENALTEALSPTKRQDIQDQSSPNTISTAPIPAL